jgi:DNA-binding NarL/FixJ family response regulator
MKKRSTEILIITRSVALQQGLAALLESLPGISRVKAIHELTNAYAWIESNRPGIVLVDAVLLDQDPEAALEKMQTGSPETQRVLLVEEVQSVDPASRHTEAILIKGIAPTMVAEVVSNLLLARGAEDEHNSNP